MTTRQYDTPVVEEYGTLFDLTADTGLLVPGLSTAASALSSPGGGVGGVNTSGDGSGGLDSLGGAPGGTTAGGTPGVPGTAGAADVGTAGEGELPFTGSEVGPVAALGATLVAAGGALRRAVRRADR